MKRMRYLLAAIAILAVVSGCASRPRQIQWIKGWSFQHNSGTNDYSLFFALCDENENYTSAAADIEIRIVNDRDEVVYEGRKSVTKEDFGTYSNQIAGERLLANVRIDDSELEEGASNSGTVYFTVSGSTFSFDEVKCDVLYCLPIKDVQLNYPALPVEIQNRSSYFGVQSKVSISDISYYMDKTAYSPHLEITIAGEKTYESSTYGGGFTIVDYKLLDSEGYVVKSGSVSLDSALSVGDKFKDDSLTIYDIIPGETYTLQFSDHF